MEEDVEAGEAETWKLDPETHVLMDPLKHEGATGREDEPRLVST